jgi:rhodanese-related sulfurtransferase
MAEEIDVQTLAEAAGSDPLILVDVREPEEYREVHVPGARLIPLSELAGRLGELPQDQRLYVICASGGRSLHAANWLAQQGWQAVSVAGGTRAWAVAGLPVHEGSGCCSG